MPCFEPLASLQVLGAHGIYLETNLGRLVDAESGFWNVPLGHGWGTSADASDKDYFSDVSLVTHPAAEALATRLCELTGFERVIFLTSGSAAVDCAIRLSFQATAEGRSIRPSLLSLKGAYHGSTGLALLAASGSYPRWMPVGSMSVTSLGPWVFNSHLNAATAREHLSNLGIDWGSLASFVFEPIQGAGGARQLSPVVFEAIAEQCRDAGTLVIADEVATGIGRAGEIIRSTQYTLSPDIVVLGKGLTNGRYPLSAVLLSKSVVNTIESSTRHTAVRYLWGETFGGTPRGCRTALEVLEEIATTTLLNDVRTRSRFTGTVLKDRLGAIDVVEEIRCPSNSMMFGIKVSTKVIAEAIRMAMLRRGFRVINEGATVLLMPMLRMPKRVLEEMVHELHDAIEEVGGTAT